MAKLPPNLAGVVLVDKDNNIVDLGETSAATALAIGTPADAAWAGTGDATVISLLKKIALNTTPP